MAKPIDQREREELCDLLLAVGPDAPTLCEGWTTFDLAAHLTLREHFRPWSARQMERAWAQGFPTVVDRVRQGAPLFPWRLPRLRVLLNGTEYFIHHEDVRRANGRSRRPDRPDLDALAWRSLGFFGRRVARSIRPFGLELRTPDGKSRRFGALPAAVVTGPASELLLFVSGRRGAAEITVTGPAEAVAALENTNVRV